MVFASSKDALRKALVGVSAEIQGTDFSEVDYQTGECKQPYHRAAEKGHQSSRRLYAGP